LLDTLLLDTLLLDTLLLDTLLLDTLSLQHSLFSTQQAADVFSQQFSWLNDVFTANVNKINANDVKIIFAFIFRIYLS
jgi:hypothetical protein